MLLNAELNNKHLHVRHMLKEDGTSTPEVGNELECLHITHQCLEEKYTGP